MKDNKDNPYSLFALLAFVVCVIWLAGALYAYDRGDGESIFDGISALFTGLAFAGMFCALVMQKQELSLQRQELCDTRDEIRLTRLATQLLADASMKGVTIEYANSRISEIDKIMVNLATYEEKLQRELDIVKEGGNEEKEVIRLNHLLTTITVKRFELFCERDNIQKFLIKKETERSLSEVDFDFTP